MAVPFVGAVIISSLIGGLVQAAGSFAGRALIAMGVGYFAYTGINTLIDGAFDAAKSNLSAAPTNVLIVMKLLKVDAALSVIFSAVAARMVLKGIAAAAGGTSKRIGLK